eukprot:COSAG02_NODE_392_length_23227_cov_30.763620_17_plen_89_part_00
MCLQQLQGVRFSPCVLNAHLSFAAQDNIFVRGIRSMKHAMFSETEEGETLALIKKLDPTWDLHAMLMSTRRSSPLVHRRRRMREEAAQ